MAKKYVSEQMVKISRYRNYFPTLDTADRFRFETNECIYAKILGRRGLLKLGTMCCHSDVINYGSLPYTDFRRTKTLCYGDDCCNFEFVRHGATRTSSAASAGSMQVSALYVAVISILDDNSVN